MERMLLYIPHPRKKEILDAYFKYYKQRGGITQRQMQDIDNFLVGSPFALLSAYELWRVSQDAALKDLHQRIDAALEDLYQRIDANEIIKDLKKDPPPS